jgi:hypothetical protein
VYTAEPPCSQQSLVSVTVHRVNLKAAKGSPPKIQHLQKWDLFHPLIIIVLHYTPDQGRWFARDFQAMVQIASNFPPGSCKVVVGGGVWLFCVTMGSGRCWPGLYTSNC